MRKAGFLAIVITALAVGGVIALILLLRPEAHSGTADDIASLAARDPEAAKAKYLYEWVRVDGTVTEILPVTDMEGAPYTSVYLKNNHGLEFQTAFEGKDVESLRVGAQAVIEGRCDLCERGVILLVRCVVVSAGK